METQTLLTTDPEITEREMLVSSRRHNVRLFRAAPPASCSRRAAMFMVAQYHHSGMFVDVSSRRAPPPAPLAHALGAAPAVRRLRSVEAVRRDSERER